MEISNLFCIKNKIAIVTGGNGGLGLAMAMALQQYGANVVVTGRNQSKNSETEKKGFSVSELDVRNENQVEDVISNTVKKFGRLDILVNNAGIYRDQSVIDLAQREWDEVMDTNLKGMYLCSKHAVKAFDLKGEGGKIINVGSMYSMFGHPHSIGYSASKTGILGLTRALAAELGPKNICVNAIIPGWFKTKINGDLPEKPRGKDIQGRTPLGRWGEPNDIQGAVVFLSSCAANFITGAVLAVDGGYHVSDRNLYEA